MLQIITRTTTLFCFGVELTSSHNIFFPPSRHNSRYHHLIRRSEDAGRFFCFFVFKWIIKAPQVESNTKLEMSIKTSCFHRPIKDFMGYQWFFFFFSSRMKEEVKFSAHWDMCQRRKQELSGLVEMKTESEACRVESEAEVLLLLLLPEDAAFHTTPSISPYIVETVDNPSLCAHMYMDRQSPGGPHLCPLRTSLVFVFGIRCCVVSCHSWESSFCSFWEVPQNSDTIHSHSLCQKKKNRKAANVFLTWQFSCGKSQNQLRWCRSGLDQITGFKLHWDSEMHENINQLVSAHWKSDPHRETAAVTHLGPRRRGYEEQHQHQSQKSHCWRELLPDRVRAHNRTHTHSERSSTRWTGLPDSSS